MGANSNMLLFYVVLVSPLFIYIARSDFFYFPLCVFMELTDRSRNVVGKIIAVLVGIIVFVVCLPVWIPCFIIRLFINFFRKLYW